VQNYGKSAEQPLSLLLYLFFSVFGLWLFRLNSAFIFQTQMTQMTRIIYFADKQTKRKKSASSASSASEKWVQHLHKAVMQ